LCSGWLRWHGTTKTFESSSANNCCIWLHSSVGTVIINWTRSACRRWCGSCRVVNSTNRAWNIDCNTSWTIWTCWTCYCSFRNSTWWAIASSRTCLNSSTCHSCAQTQITFYTWYTLGNHIRASERHISTDWTRGSRTIRLYRTVFSCRANNSLIRNSPIDRSITTIVARGTFLTACLCRNLIVVSVGTLSRGWSSRWTVMTNRAGSFSCSRCAIVSSLTNKTSGIRCWHTSLITGLAWRTCKTRCCTSRPSAWVVSIDVTWNWSKCACGTVITSWTNGVCNTCGATKTIVALSALGYCWNGVWRTYTSITWGTWNLRCRSLWTIVSCSTCNASTVGSGNTVRTGWTLSHTCDSTRTIAWDSCYWTGTYISSRTLDTNWTTLPSHCCCVVTIRTLDWYHISIRTVVHLTTLRDSCRSALITSWTTLALSLTNLILVLARARCHVTTCAIVADWANLTDSTIVRSSRCLTSQTVPSFVTLLVGDSSIVLAVKASWTRLTISKGCSHSCCSVFARRTWGWRTRAKRAVEACWANSATLTKNSRSNSCCTL